jgi:hypothetical protein
MDLVTSTVEVGIALTIEVLADAPGVFDFKFTRRRSAESYRAMGHGSATFFPASV